MRRRCPGCRQTGVREVGRPKPNFRLAPQAQKRCQQQQAGELHQVCRRWTGGKMRSQPACATPRHMKHMVFSAG